MERESISAAFGVRNNNINHSFLAQYAERRHHCIALKRGDRLHEGKDARSEYAVGGPGKVFHLRCEEQVFCAGGAGLEVWGGFGRISSQAGFGHFHQPAALARKPFAPPELSTP